MNLILTTLGDSLNSVRMFMHSSDNHCPSFDFKSLSSYIGLLDLSLYQDDQAYILIRFKQTCTSPLDKFSFHHDHSRLKLISLTCPRDGSFRTHLNHETWYVCIYCQCSKPSANSPNTYNLPRQGHLVWCRDGDHILLQKELLTQSRDRILQPHKLVHALA